MEKLQPVLRPEDQLLMKQVEQLATGSKTNSPKPVASISRRKLTHQQRVQQYL
jgi:hypothetical protein